MTHMYMNWSCFYLQFYTCLLPRRTECTCWLYRPIHSRDTTWLSAHAGSIFQYTVGIPHDWIHMLALSSNKQWGYHMTECICWLYLPLHSGDITWLNAHAGSIFQIYSGDTTWPKPESKMEVHNQYLKLCMLKNG